jgi:putative redox protein
MTVALYARRKGWPLQSVDVRLEHSKEHAKDCVDCESKDTKLDHIRVELRLNGVLSDEQSARLLEIANRCPVHRTLTSEIRITSRLV